MNMDNEINGFNRRSSKLVLKDLVKQFRSVDSNEIITAVDNINLQLNDGEMTTLLGPSGCGKTTTLRMVAGFESPSSGDILIGDKSVANVPPNKRDFAMMFQSYALFPHLTIYENIAYGLRIKKITKAEIASKTNKIIDLMQLKGMEDRYPSQVSGGQQQRIALARAVVIEPRVLLFDEPLSNLDAKLREYMREELRKIQQRLKITSLYVTHDQAEAMAISDKVVIMKDGLIIQEGSPKNIYEQPNSRFVANFMGKSNFISCTILDKENDNFVVKLNQKNIYISNTSNTNFKKGDKAVIIARPEAISLSKDITDISGIVNRATYFGSKVEYEIEVNKENVIVETYNPHVNMIFKVGQKIGVNLDSNCLRLLPEKDFFEK